MPVRYWNVPACAAAFAAIGTAAYAVSRFAPLPSGLPAEISKYAGFGWLFVPALALAALVAASALYAALALARLSRLPAAGAVPSLAAFGTLAWAGWFLLFREPHYTPFAEFAISQFGSPLLWGGSAAFLLALVFAALSFRNRETHA